MWHTRLLNAYSETFRAYHTAQHLGECLDLLDRHGSEPAGLMEMVLRFHDAVYDPRASDNEERSAELARIGLKEGGVASTEIAEVERLIMLTKSHQPGGGPDDSLLIDIDLAIFGQNEDRFDEYEKQIRLEYSWVPDPIYRTRRVEVLTAFLQRQSIFMTREFQELFEANARVNIRRLISTLSFLT